jgi:hypothetical protein
MSHIRCPHCGFTNFSISAYCGRCERPLKAAPTTPPALAATPKASPSTNNHQTSAPPPLPLPVRLTSAKPTPVPAPPPPVFQPQTKPIELGQAVLAEASTRAEHATSATVASKALPISPHYVAETELGVEDSDANEIAEVRVALATGRQLVMSRAVDIGLVVGAGLLVTLVEAYFSTGSSRIRAAGLLDWVAQWLDAHRAAAQHGMLAAVLLGFVHNGLFGLHGGRTLGRMLAGTVLVRGTGEPLTAMVVLRRTAAVLLSILAGGAGFFWSWVDRQHRTWHDLFAGTVIVQRYASLPESETKS